MASIPDAWLVAPAQLGGDEDPAHPAPDPLVARALLRDEAALTALHAAHAAGILRFLSDLLGDHAAAADATQETFVRAFRRLDTLRGADRVAPWLFGIARNVSLEYLRARRRRGRVLVHAEPRGGDDVTGEAADAHTPEADLLGREAAGVVERALGRLSAIVASISVSLAGACGRAPDGDRAGAEAVPAGAAGATVYRVPVDGAPARGDARAAVTLVAFSDYECAFCGRADALLAQLRKAYGPKIRTVMRQHPLPIHAHARAAAIAALAADEQGQFWPMHERLFASARSLDEESLVRLAREAGLDVARWQQARAGAGPALARDEALAETLGVRATPTFFVNGRRIEGAQSIDLFQQTIDEEIAKVGALMARGVRADDVYATLMKDAVERAPPLAAVKRGAAAPAVGVAPAAAPGADDPGCGAPGEDCGCKGDHVDEPDPERVDVPVGAGPTKGPEGAPVTVVVFSDFECPFCAHSEATLRALLAQYGDKVRLAWKNHPLPMHPSARLAARAALAAADQGKFWEYHDVLFAHQDALDPASLERYAKDLGLDAERFRRVMADGGTEALVAADDEEATRLGVTGTPTFFVNGRKIIGAQPLARFQAGVERALVEAQR